MRIEVECGIEGQLRDAAQTAQTNRDLDRLMSTEKGREELESLQSDARQTYKTLAKITTSTSNYFPNVPLPNLGDSVLGIGSAKGWGDMCARLKSATDKNT